MNWREKIGYAFLKKGYKPSEHKRRAVNLTEAQSVFVIFTASTDKEAREKLQLLDIIKTNWAIPRVDYLVYMPFRKNPEWLEQITGIKSINKKDLNWNLKPNYTNDITYDLLIDLDLELSIPTLYLAVMTKAKMKVTAQLTEKELFYDLFIVLGDQNTLSNYIKQTEFYLKLINQKELVYG